jgi:serine/threonine protein kinase
VVPLLGYCSERQGRQLERLLVFECMPNGNLRECLDLKGQGRKPMDWATRVSVALGAARGLEYLHEAAAPRILHRDIKSTNILLDDKFRAKVWFGLIIILSLTVKFLFKIQEMILVSFGACRSLILAWPSV